MAKGQKRSNRETKKPKQEKKAAPEAENPFRKQFKQGTSSNPARGKGRT